MGRRSFLRAGIALGGLAPLAAGPWTRLAAQPVPPATGRSGHATGEARSWTIRDYLSHEAKLITERALKDCPDAATWRRLLPQKRNQFLEMLGLDQWWTERRAPPPVTVTGVVERETFRIENLYFESLPQLYVTGNLYIPKKPRALSPAVLYLCGHALQPRARYQAHARRFAELGFICLIIDTVQRGEIRGHHHGCYREGWWQWYSRGYSPAGIETLNGIRALDLLAARPDVDAGRLGITGISGGGVVSWWLGATDERVKVIAPVCGTATLYSHIHDRTIDGNCDCVWWTNIYRWDQADVGALIAPRPMLIGATDQDEMFTIGSNHQAHGHLRGLYRTLGAEENLRLVVTPGQHAYHERSRTEIFSWFVKHLQGRDVPPREIGDLDVRPEKQESFETLRVFVMGSPPGNRTPTIQDDFIVLPKPPAIADATALARERTRVIRELKRLTFGAFPAEPPPLDVQIEHAFIEGPIGRRFAFTSEEGWRLHGLQIRRSTIPTPAPALVTLVSPGDGRLDPRGVTRHIDAPWAGIGIATRGTVDTAWGEELNWHLRRASAWTGRTIPSMRVWDTLRALAAVRQLPEIDSGRVALHARGEMCAVALYAALLDGGLSTLFLENPPATQNAPGRSDGRGPILEMLNCLRITDLPQIAGLLWPAELVFVGETPASYQWAEELYRKLGDTGKITRVASLRSWTP